MHSNQITLEKQSETVAQGETMAPITLQQNGREAKYMNTNEQHDRPEFVSQAMLQFLSEARAEGRTNMSAAPAMLEDMFCLDYDEALAALTYWTQTFCDVNNEQHEDK